jgi:hypothetical protein
MVIDYWLAGYFGRVWLWLRKGLRLPRRSDFWLMLISALALFGILAAAGLG